MNDPASILAGIVQGDEAAFAMFFDLYADRVYSALLAYTKDEHVSEELLQDVFLSIWIKRDNLKRVDKIEGYLFVTAKNHYFNFLEKAKRQNSFKENLQRYFSEVSISPEDEFILKQAGEHIDRIISDLPEQQRLVFELRRNEGLKPDEIADRLGLSPKTVRNHLTLAQKAIRQQLQAGNDGLLLLAAFILLS